MSGEQEQVDALPGEWSESGRRSWQLDTDALNMLRFSFVSLSCDAEGVWLAKVDGVTDEGVYVVAKGKTARAALERLARVLDQIGCDLMQASRELING
jgi:hypothetical protein